jgi:RNA polymerase subunit RPABC4/transcription elongation factor Spt4
MGSPIIQAEREVWDSYGAGPLQRFTANGRLVHNCALILDHSDTTQRLGFVTDITHEHLDDGKPKPKKAVEEKKKPLPRECEQCAALMPPRTKICPNCQHESKITSSIMEQDGELVELQPGKITLAKKGRAKEYTEPERRQFFAELKAHAIMKQYKPGWAANQYREKFKGWPPRYFDNVEPAKVLGPDVAMWIKSRMIAWAKSKRNHTVAADAQKHDA